MNMETEYSYTKRNLFLLPKEHYMYSAFTGFPFLESYKKNRNNFVSTFSNKVFNYSQIFTKTLLQELLEEQAFAGVYFEKETKHTSLTETFTEILNRIIQKNDLEDLLNNQIYPMVKSFEVTKRLKNSEDELIVYPMFANLLASICNINFNAILFNALLKLNDMCISAFLPENENSEEIIFLTLYALKQELKIYDELVVRVL